MRRTTVLFTLMLTLLVTISQTTYAQIDLKALFGLGGGKKSGKNIATPHADVFTDDYGISGSYHLWRPWLFEYSTGWAIKQKTANTINLDFNGKAHTDFYLGEEDTYGLGMPRAIWADSLWNVHKVYYTQFSGKYGISPSREFVEDVDIEFYSLEDGVIIIAEITKSEEAPFY